MTQRVVPSSPPYMGSYVISTTRPTLTGNVVFEVVTDQLQRLYVTMPNRQTDGPTIDTTIRAALGALYRPPDPVR
jgi:hypothetical protein